MKEIFTTSTSAIMYVCFDGEHNYINTQYMYTSVHPGNRVEVAIATVLYSRWAILLNVLHVIVITCQTVLRYSDVRSLQLQGKTKIGIDSNSHTQFGR